MASLNPKWRGFFKHLGSYIIIIGMLAMINLITSPDSWWFYWPAMGWGIGLAFHLLGVVLGEDKGEKQRKQPAGVAPLEEDSLKPSYSVKHDEETLPSAKRSSNTGELASRTLQAYVERALAYQNQIDGIIKASADNNTSDRLQELGAEVSEWIKAITNLARRVDGFQQNALVRQDLETVPQAIADLEGRLADESDPNLRAQLERTLANRQNQLASLEQLHSTMKRAEIQIESTVSSLGTIYSQLLTGQSTDQVADHSRLLADVDEEVNRLRDQLEALEEVKFGSRI
jgi:hypothetical protein